MPQAAPRAVLVVTDAVGLPEDLLFVVLRLVGHNGLVRGLVGAA